jgi:hypothetical protein
VDPFAVAFLLSSLGADDFRAREAATVALRRCPLAYGAVAAAVGTKDAEVSRRAQQVLYWLDAERRRGDEAWLRELWGGRPLPWIDDGWSGVTLAEAEKVSRGRSLNRGADGWPRTSIDDWEAFRMGARYHVLTHLRQRPLAEVRALLEAWQRAENDYKRRFRPD